MNQRVEYEHTQIGWLMMVISLLIEAVLLVVLTADPRSRSFQNPIPYVFLLPLLVVALFGTLKVQIAGDYLKIAFGVGLIRKTFPLAEVQKVEKVRNKWWYGWGIHAGLFHGFNWLFNVSGLDAVQIRMENNHAYRIGTDDLDNLFRALEKRIGSIHKGVDPIG